MTMNNFEQARQFFGTHPAASLRGIAQNVVDLSRALKNFNVPPIEALSRALKNFNVPPIEANTPLSFTANLLSLLLACDLDCLGELGSQCAQLEPVRNAIKKWALAEAIAEAKGPFVDVGILELE